MTLTIADMEQAIRDMESEGYENVKVTQCKYWEGVKL